MGESRGELHFRKYMEACVAYAKQIIYLKKYGKNSYKIEPDPKDNFRNCLVLGTMLNFSCNEIVENIRDLIRDCHLNLSKVVELENNNYDAYNENRNKNFDKISLDHTPQLVETYKNLKNYIYTITSDTDLVFSELPPFTDDSYESYHAKEKCEFLCNIISSLIPTSEVRSFSPKNLQKKRKGDLLEGKAMYLPLINKEEVITFYKKALQEVLDLLVNHRVKETLNVKNNSEEKHITEILAFKKWLKIAQLYGIDGNVLISDNLNPKQLLSFKSMKYATNCNDEFRMYHNLCLNSAELEIKSNNKNSDMREIAIFFGEVIDIYPEATAEHIEEYKDAVQTKHFIDSFNEIVVEEKNDKVKSNRHTVVEVKNDKIKSKRYTIDFVDWIRELNIKYRIPNIYFNVSDRKAKRKISMAMDNYANEARNEKVIFSCDTTILGGADEGFLVTDKCIYINNSFEESNKIMISEIERVKIPKRAKSDLLFFSGQNTFVRAKGISYDEYTTKRTLGLILEVISYLREHVSVEE